ncbi:AAA family ATPase [Pseudobacillus badius]|uniref:AAA family ATPase n=1 Tax=Bacillus badius TaxID=1455 RepID=UPI0007B09EE8|nr:ATP-binding protein [Bacillus badius]OCS90187.1 ATP-binding protein [Bacillus badius]OVE53716.1 ATP-binding protein [Bacillus badius]TDW06097.1 cell division protease FtsH [Bacillus badius]
MEAKSNLMKKLFPLFALIAIIIAAVSWSLKDVDKPVTVSFSSMEKIIQEQNGAPVSLEEKPDGALYLTTKDHQYVSYTSPGSSSVDRLVETYNIRYSYSNKGPYDNWIIGGVLLAVIALAAVLYKKGRSGANSSTKAMKNSLSKAVPLPSITLNDIGGLSAEMKAEIKQTLAILKNPERSAEIGVKAPRGILLYGPPGTGKTLLAQAIAKELNATFFSASGSAFTELFVGVGASRVRSLFEQARKQKPAVIFIDEVDALAGRRKAHGGEEAERTLTELLVQLDGGHSNDDILFIAATNRKDMLDEAFLRPGRIDFSFLVPLPDTKGRREIIDIHIRGKKLADNVLSRLEDLAESTSGFSGAELSSLFETASRSAIRNERSVIEKSDLDYALDRTILGSTSRTLQDPETKRRVAIHEAGHALVAAATNPGSVRKATIIPRGQALGYVAPIPKELHLSTASELMDQVAMILSGGTAERKFLGEHSIGVSGDVQQAKQIIEQMVDMGVLQDGFTLTFGKMERETKMQELFQKALSRSETLIAEREDQFHQLVDALLKKETLEGWEVEQIVNGSSTANEVSEKEAVLV